MAGSLSVRRRSVCAPEFLQIQEFPPDIFAVVNRVLRDDPSKGDMHNRQAISPKMMWECLSDYHMWPIYLIGLTWLIPSGPMTSYLTLQLRSLGFDTFQTNLLTVRSPRFAFPQPY